MKTSFSTLGCPEWSWEDMVVTAKDLGFDGIEVRGIENELYVPKAKPFTEINIKGTRERLDKLHLGVPCLTSSCYLFNKSNISFYLQEGKEYIDLAEKLQIPYVRVLGDANPQPGDSIDTGYVAENITILAEYAAIKNVKVLIETNGVFANSDVMAKFISRVNHASVGVLWDIHHPYRYMNEPVGKTYSVLKNHIEFIHIKDSVMDGGKVKYKMMGYGDVPVKDALLLLKKDSYPGFVSLEWVKRWCIDLEEPGVVFSQFINYVKTIIK